MESEEDFPLPGLQNHLNLENSLYVWCLHRFRVVHSLADVQSLQSMGGLRYAKRNAYLWKKRVPPTKKFLVVSVCWGEENWKPLNIPAGIFPSPFGNRQQLLSGEISFALSRSEKFLRGILVLGKRNQTQLIPSGPMLLIKPTEFGSAGPAWGHGWGWSKDV